MSEDLKNKLTKAADDLANWKNRHPVISHIERETTKTIENLARGLWEKCTESQKPSKS